MSRFRRELDLVPLTAWAIGLVVGVALFLLMMLLPFRVDPVGRHWPLIVKLFFSLLAGLPVFALVLLIGYVNVDARRRGMRYVMWTLLAIFIPNAIGIILYFVLREPLLAHCTQCGTSVRQGFAFCPKCGSSLSLACPQCRRAVEPAWSHCVYCGEVLRRT